VTCPLRFTRLLMFALVLAPALAGAQTNVGEISGRVTDQSNSALPGALVTATNELTALAQKSTTDAGGGYVFASLPAYFVASSRRRIVVQLEGQPSARSPCTGTLDHCPTTTAFQH
jgi:hypothetical protein